MFDQEMLKEVTAIAHDVGRRVLALPPPARFRTPQELRAIFTGIDAPLQAFVRSRLGGLRPEAAWVEELEGRVPETGEAWVVDAIDGAVQYLQGLPQWCVSITLVRGGAPVLAVLHSPLQEETYAAVAGGGAMRNAAPVEPSTKTDLAVALVTTSQPPFWAKTPGDPDRAGRSLGNVLLAAGAVRNFGPTSWQIADVASGRIDAFWQYGVDDGNLLGASLLAKEAGATVTDLLGMPWRAGADSILAAAPGLHRRLLDLLPTDRSPHFPRERPHHDA
jgi:myo-inositol-1(or 4)-monophosphatase